MAITVAVLVGTGIAATAVILAIRALRAKVEKLAPAVRPQGAVGAAIAMAVLAFPVAWWVAFIIGGNFGGAFAAIAGEQVGAQWVLVPVGISLGIAVVTSVVVVTLSFIAFWTARLVQRR